MYILCGLYYVFLEVFTRGYVWDFYSQIRLCWSKLWIIFLNKSSEGFAFTFWIYFFQISNKILNSNRLLHNGLLLVLRSKHQISTFKIVSYLFYIVLMSIGWDVKWCPVSRETTPLARKDRLSGYRWRVGSWMTARETSNFTNVHRWLKVAAVI